MKRFTETEKWRDPWFWKLSSGAKLLWFYVCDNCDAAGVIELHLDLASKDIGHKLEQSHLAELSSRFAVLPCGKLWITGFIRFQYGKLSPDCKPHAKVFDSLSKYQIELEAVDQNQKFRHIVSPEVRKRIIKRDAATCVYTQRRLFDWEIAIDHIFPRSLGGTDDDANLAVMDKELNAMKGEDSVFDFCHRAKLSYSEIIDRLSKATGVASERLQEEDKKKTGRGEEEKKDRKKAQPADLVECKAYAVERGLPESDGEWFWDRGLSSGWRNKGEPFRDWKATLRTWQQIKILPSQKGQVNGHRAELIPVWKQIEIITEEISVHPANPQFRGFNSSTVTEDQRHHLRLKREKLAELKSQQSDLIK